MSDLSVRLRQILDSRVYIEDVLAPTGASSTCSDLIGCYILQLSQRLQSVKPFRDRASFILFT